MVATERLLVWEEGGETLSGKIPVEDAFSFTLSLHAPNQIPRLHFDSDEAMDGAMEKVWAHKNLILGKSNIVVISETGDSAWTTFSSRAPANNVFLSLSLLKMRLSKLYSSM